MPHENTVHANIPKISRSIFTKVIRVYREKHKKNLTIIPEQNADSYLLLGQTDKQTRLDYITLHRLHTLHTLHRQID